MSNLFHIVIMSSYLCLGSTAKQIALPPLVTNSYIINMEDLDVKWLQMFLNKDHMNLILQIRWSL